MLKIILLLTSSISLYLLHLTFYTIQCDILIIYIFKYTHLKFIKSEYYESMRLDDSYKILIGYIFSYTLTVNVK